MRWSVWALIAAACGAKPPESLDNARVQIPPLQHVTWTPLASAPRPKLDIEQLVPDFHDELRWPLTGMTHPKLEPEYPIATMLADQGVGWTDLCRIGAQNRQTSGNKDITAYLRGWCSVIKDDVDGACRDLVPLLGSVTRGLGAAVRIDLANILVNEGDADKAEHWLSRHRIRDIGTLDLLAANYVELGQPGDAYVINRRVMDSDDHATAATQCRRLVRNLMLGGDRFWSVEQLRVFAVDAKAPDPTCVELHEMLTCREDPGAKCVPYFQARNIDARAQDLFAIYFAWPKTADFERWWAIAIRAVALMPVEGADQLAVAAFEAATRANGNVCAGLFVDSIQHARRELVRLQPPNTAPLQPRLAELLAHCYVRR